MKEFLFRLPFALLFSYVGSKRGGIIRMIIYSFIGCIVGELLYGLM